MNELMAEAVRQAAVPVPLSLRLLDMWSGPPKFHALIVPADSPLSSPTTMNELMAEAVRQAAVCIPVPFLSPPSGHVVGAAEISCFNCSTVNELMAEAVRQTAVCVPVPLFLSVLWACGQGRRNFVPLCLYLSCTRIHARSLLLYFCLNHSILFI
jgi:hypothetical protein